MNYLFLLLMVLIACKETGKKQKRIVTTDLIGEWNNIYMKVDFYSEIHPDSGNVLEVDRDHWEEKLKIKPIRTFYRADSTWNSAHLNLHDSLVYNPSGKWWLEGDSLVMQQLFPSLDTTRYKFTLNGDTASFECMIDLDGDGTKNDHYFGRQIKVKR
jgi:hypothetical protein